MKGLRSMSLSQFSWPSAHLGRSSFDFGGNRRAQCCRTMLGVLLSRSKAQHQVVDAQHVVSVAQPCMQSLPCLLCCACSKQPPGCEGRRCHNCAFACRVDFLITAMPLLWMPAHSLVQETGTPLSVQLSWVHPVANQPVHGSIVSLQLARAPLTEPACKTPAAHFAWPVPPTFKLR